MSTTDEDPDKVVKNSWTPEEDALLREQIDNHGGPGNWTAIAEALVGRSSKSCRLRWCNQLNPSVKRGPFTEEEDKKILAAHAVYGNKWAVISRGIPGRTDNQVKNRFNSTLRRVLAAGARVGSAPSAPSAKRRRLSERDSPSSPGKSANSCETRAVAESGSENNAVVGLEQLVAASLQVERRESDGEAEDDTSTKSTNTKAHAAAGAADGEGSVRGARAFADHASLLAGMQLQQQLAQLASMAYPAFHGVSVNSMPATFPTAKVVPVTPAPAPEPSAASAMDPALVAGNSFVAALQAQLAVSHAASQVKSMWDPMQAMQYASQQAPSPADLAMAARAILAAQSVAGAPR